MGRAGQDNGSGRHPRVTAQAAIRQDPRALERARQAVRCLPFRLRFYRELDAAALSSTQLVARTDWPELLQQPLSAHQAEDLFIWLIQLGVLRREVDGQGLTERVRLTPLGRQVLTPWQEGIPPAGPASRLRHWLRRHRPRL
jgi:hypothetical protein